MRVRGQLSHEGLGLAVLTGRPLSGPSPESGSLLFHDYDPRLQIFRDPREIPFIGKESSHRTQSGKLR